METEQHFLSLDDAWPAGPLGATFLTSYTFHGPFFESKLMPLLRARGAHPIIVFLDRRQGYATAMTTIGALQEVGRSYLLIPYDPGRFAFHPKVHLFCGPGGTCLVGSGNLTPHGCGGNLEAFDILDPAEDRSSIAAVRAFFRDLLGRCAESIPPTDLSWLESQIRKRNDPPPGTGDSVFIQSLSEGIGDQFHGHLLEDHFTKLLVAAPFQNERHEITRRLKKSLNGPAVRIAANPLEAPKKPRDFKVGELADPEGRALHAKVLYARGREASVLMIGSANLTSRAWDPDKNVEACVVRPTLDLDELDDWLEAAPFVETSWSEASPIAWSEGSGLDELPVQWARLEGETLRVAMSDIGEPVRFAVETSASRQPVELRPAGEDLLRGTVPDLRNRPALLCAQADGWEPTRVLVIQPAELRRNTRAVRLEGIRRRAQGGLPDSGDRQEVLACITRVIAALHQSALEYEDGEPPPRTASSTQPPDSGSRGLEDEDGAQDEIEELESLFPGIITRRGPQGQNLGQLVALIDALGKKGDDQDGGDTNGDQWNPARLDGISLPPSHQDSGEEPDEGEELDDDDELAEPEEGDPNPEEVEAVRRLAARTREMIEELLDEGADGPGVISRLMIRTLTMTAAYIPASRLALFWDLLDWLEWGWAVADWPGTEEGWALPEQEDASYPEEAQWSLLVAAHWLLENDTQPTRVKDQAYRILAGMEGRFEGAEGEGPSLASLCEAGGPEVTDLEDLRADLIGHQTLGEKARHLVAPLWWLDRDAARRRDAAGLRDDLEKELRACQAYCEARSKRNKNRKKAEEDMALIQVKLEDARARAEEAEETYAVAEALLGERNPDLLRLWKKKSRSRSTNEGDRKVFPKRKRGIPGCCNVGMPTKYWSIFDDPTQVLRCPKCGVLVASGPGKEERDA